MREPADGASWQALGKLCRWPCPQLLEPTQTHLRFDAKDVAKFNALVESMQSARNQGPCIAVVT